MQWLSKSLNRKFAIGTAAGLLASSLFFLVLFMSLYRGQLERDQRVAADQVSRLVQASLAGLLHENDLAGLKDRVKLLTDAEGILSISIADRDGRLLVASDSAAVGEVFAPPQGPRLDAGLELVDGRTLYVDFDATPIRLRARATTLLLMGSGALIVLINLAGGWWFMRRYVVRPAARLTDASERLAAGELDTSIHLPGHDEFSLLADRFNGMAESLRGKIEELQQNEDYLQALVDAIPDGVRVIDEDFRVVLANESYRRQLGYGDGEPAPPVCYAATHGLDAPCPGQLRLCTLKEVTATNEPLRLVERHVRADGEKLDVETYAAPLRVMRDGRLRHMVVESIRDLRRQVRFSHEQRLSELGRLAAGVAHEIHNPLTSLRLVVHAAERTNQKMPGEHQAELAQHLTLVMQQVDQCERVTERLLKLSMPPSTGSELVNLNAVLDDTLKLLAWEAEIAGIKTELQVVDPPLRVLAADSDLRMMALNLAQNACHAMPQGGRLLVRCVRQGAQVVVRFEDNGIGIVSADLQSIFEPFFSRRADGVRGTGLGLPITKAIVEGHGGSIAVDSTPGQGSRFTVRFPDADALTAEDAGARADSAAVAGQA